MTRTKLSKLTFVVLATAFMLASLLAVFAVPVRSSADIVTYAETILIKADQSNNTLYSVKVGDSAYVDGKTMTEIEGILNGFTTAQNIAVNFEGTEQNPLALSEPINIGVTEASYYFTGFALIDSATMGDAAIIVETASNAKLIMDATITGTGNAGIIINNGNGLVTVSGGTLLSTGGRIVSGVDTQTVTSQNYTIVIKGNGGLQVNGGTVSSYVSRMAQDGGNITADNRAIINEGNGAVVINGGTVSVERYLAGGSDGKHATYGIYYSADAAGKEGSVIEFRGYAIENKSNANITVENGANITSVAYIDARTAGWAPTADLPTADRPNTTTTAYAYVIYNAGTGNISVTNSEVKSLNTIEIAHKQTSTSTTAGKMDVTYEEVTIFNNSTGSVTVTDSTVDGGCGTAIYNNSTGFVQVNEVNGKTLVNTLKSTDSATTASDFIQSMTGSIFLASGIANQTILEVNGGTVQNSLNTTNTKNISNMGVGNVVINSGHIIAGALQCVNNSWSIKLDQSGKALAGSGNSIYNHTTGKIIINQLEGKETVVISATVGVSGTSAGTINLLAGSLEFNGGKVMNISSGTNGRGIFNQAGGTVTINGGEITGQNHSIQNAGAGHVVVNGGTIKSGASLDYNSSSMTQPASGVRAIHNAGAGTVTINGGHITFPQTAIHNAAAGTININGGMVETTSHVGVYKQSGKPDTYIYHTGNYVINNAAAGTVNISGTAHLKTAYINGVINMGNVNGRLNITGGKIEHSAELEEAVIVKNSNATITLGSTSPITTTSPISVNIPSGVLSQYTGNPVTPALDFFNNAVNSANYTLSYSDNVNVGFGTATLKLSTELGGTEFVGKFYISKGQQDELRINSPATIDYPANTTYTLSTEGGSGNGAVTYSIVSGGTGAGTINGNTLTITKAGTIILSATKASSNNYLATTSENFTLKAAATQAQLEFASASHTISFGEQFTLPLLNGGTTAGNIIYTVLPNSTGNVTIDASGVVTCVNTGVVYIKATMLGNDDYLDVDSNTFTLTINVANQTPLEITSATTHSFGSVYTITYTGGSTNGLVSYVIDTTKSTAEGTISGDELTITKVGTFYITATMAGNENYQEVSSQEFVLVIEKGTQSPLVFTSLNMHTTGDYTITVSGGTTNGQLSYYYYPEKGSGSAVLVGNILTVSTAGKYYIEVVMAGDEYYNEVSTGEFVVMSGQAQDPLTFAQETATHTFGTSYTLPTPVGGSEANTNAIEYVLISGPASAVIVGNVLTVVEIGKYVIQAIKPADSVYIDAVSTNNFTLTVEAMSIVDGMFAEIDGEFVFNDDEKEPTVVALDVVVNGVATALMLGQDYTVSYNNNVNASEVAEVIIAGIGNYQGTVVKYFTISRKALTDDQLGAVLGTFTYNGNAHTPNAVVTGLTENDDYVVKYENNINASTQAKVIIEGIGNYTGEVFKYFTIGRKSLNGMLQGVVDGPHYYTGSAVEPMAVVYDAQRNEYLVHGVDFEIDYYMNNINKGSNAEIGIVGIGNYSSDDWTNFTISPRIITDDMIGEIVGTYIYKGAGHTNLSFASVQGYNLVLDMDFYIESYSNNIDVGTATAYIVGTGNYTGTIERTFEITPKALVDGMLEDVEGEFIYNGAQHTPTPVVTGLVENVDYTVSYENNILVGTAKVIVTGMGNYTGSIYKEFAVSPQPLSNQLEKVTGSYFYNGDPHTPSPVVNGGLTLGVDYTVSHSDNINAGTATLTITGIGNYTGTLSETFTIIPLTLTAGMVSNIEGTFVYNGLAHTPAVVVTGLTVDADYTVSYQNNLNAGTATVVVVGRGNYFGTINKTFSIVRKELDNELIKGVVGTIVYDGTLQTPELEVAEIVTSNDYTVTYQSNRNAGTAKAIVVGKGNFTGTLEVTFTIAPKTLTNELADIEGTFTYNGADQTPTVVVTGLTINTHYTVTYENNRNVGTAKVTVEGRGNYTGTLETTFTIVPKTLTNELADIQGTFVYNGSAHTPTAVVTGLTVDVDYTVTYENNLNAGTATVVVVGKDNYTGTISKNFTIAKASGEGSVEITGWVAGEEAVAPTLASDTNGIENATIEYKVANADDSTYSATVPTEAGEYTIRVTFASSANYAEVVATANFTITASETPEPTPPEKEGCSFGTVDSNDSNGALFGLVVVIGLAVGVILKKRKSENV